MIEEITDKVDKATGHLQVCPMFQLTSHPLPPPSPPPATHHLIQYQGLNDKIKDALEQVGGPSRIIVNVILLVVVIAIGAFACVCL
jgi:hypothetical protein